MNSEFFLSAWGCCLLSAIYSTAEPTVTNGLIQSLFTLLAMLSIGCWGVTRKDTE